MEDDEEADRVLARIRHGWVSGVIWYGSLAFFAAMGLLAATRWPEWLDWLEKRFLQ